MIYHVNTKWKKNISIMLFILYFAGFDLFVNWMVVYLIYDSVGQKNREPKDSQFSGLGLV